MIRSNYAQFKVTHRPTGRVAIVSHYGRGRPLKESRDLAILLAKSLASSNDPPTHCVRSYHIDPPGVDSYVKDERTKEFFRGSEVIVSLLEDGKIELVAGNFFRVAEFKTAENLIKFTDHCASIPTKAR